MPLAVEYATTTDGVRIAYAIHGKGRPLLWMPPIPGRHLELDWQQPRERQWLEWLANRYLLVHQYDPRGLGLSERAVSSYSLDEFVRDLDAVVARLPAGEVALIGKVNAAPLAIAYAARRPACVSHLVLWCATPVPVRWVDLPTALGWGASAGRRRGAQLRE